MTNLLLHTMTLISTEKWFYISIGLIALTASWIIGKVLKTNLLRTKPTQEYNNLFLTIAGSFIKIICILCGFLILIGTLGVNVGSIIQGFAFLGFGISFILKDLISDVIAGFFIITYKPFKIGQELTISLDDKSTYRGKAITVDIRYTTLDNNQQTILIPNSFLFKQPLCLSKTNSF